MSKTVATTIIVTSVNHVPDADAKQLMNKYSVDSLDEVASEMEGDVETIIAKHLFGDADEIPILDVDTEVYDDWDGATDPREVDDE